MSVEILLVLFCIACLAGFIDSMAGGGGLLTIPALLMAGLPPALALGTNKLQACGGAFSASWYFYRRGLVNLRAIWLLITMTFIGAAIGTWLIQRLDPHYVKLALPFLIVAVGLYFLFTPNLGKQDTKQRLSYTAFAFTASLALGFYDGFFGPGSGSLLCLAFVTLLGFNLTNATAHSKVLNFTSNIVSLSVFALGGQVWWSVGAVMLVGQIIGAQLGAKLVLTKGQRLIRPMVVAMAFLMSVKMLYEQYGA